MACPICLRETTSDPCECGYAFATADRSVAARRAERVLEQSTRKMWLGLGLLATLPLTVVGSMMLPGFAVIGFFAVPAELFVGVGWATRGASWRRAARQRLARAVEPAALPAARVVSR